MSSDHALVGTRAIAVSPARLRCQPLGPHRDAIRAMTTGRNPINFAPEAYAAPTRPLSRNITEGPPEPAPTPLGWRPPSGAPTSPQRRWVLPQAPRAPPASAPGYSRPSAPSGPPPARVSAWPQTARQVPVERLVTRDASEEFRPLQVSKDVTRHTALCPHRHATSASRTPAHALLPHELRDECSAQANPLSLSLPTRAPASSLQRSGTEQSRSSSGTPSGGQPPEAEDSVHIVVTAGGKEIGDFTLG